MASACGGTDRADPTSTPPAAGDANLRLVGVRFTQGAQTPDGAIPLVAGMPAAVNVLVQRSRDGVAAVPVVLRLFRAGTLVRTDTARTGGVLSLATDAAFPSAQFLIPGGVITDSLTWQVEIDPAQSVADSTRSDNQLPLSEPALIPIVHLPTFDVRLVPIMLPSQGGVVGNVTPANAEGYLTGVRALLPTGALTYSVGTPLSVQANFGTAPAGGIVPFWLSAIQDIDIARATSSSPTSTWLGIVPLPPGFNSLTYGGYAFIPESPASFGGGTRSALSLEFTPQFGTTYVHELVAHELTHTFGRSHAAGCGAGAPLDPAFPGVNGVIGTVGHDVWRWATGVTTSALARSATTGDVMSYCSPVWTSPYTWSAVLRWREASAVVVTSTARTRVTLVAGSIGSDGAIALRPALDADAIMPAADSGGDVMVELRGTGGGVLRRVRVRSASASESGTRYFLAVMPTVGDAATEVVATSVTGASARLRRRYGIDTVSTTVTSSGATEIRSSAGNALLVRDEASGDVMGIGWNGRITVPSRSGLSLTVSDGVRSTRRAVTPQ